MELDTKTAALNNSDNDLIQQAKQGSMEAFHALYQRYLSAVYKRVRFLIPADDVDDVTQEVFIATYQSLPSFRGDGHFGAWLRTLTHRKIAEFYRKRSLKHNPPVVSLFEGLRSSEGNPEALEDVVQVRLALQELPERYREIILLRFAEELQFHEIAEGLGQSLEAVRSLYRRAITALTERLQDGNTSDFYDTHE